MFKIIKATDKKVLDLAVKTLRRGGLLVYPTETCYGIGADATNQEAVNTLLAFKTRREGKPFSVAVSDRRMAQKYVIINQTAQNLYDNYLPGPLTVVSKGRHRLARGIESEYGTLGIRIPDYPLVRDIVHKLGHPITATSANVSYRDKPYSIEALLRDLPQKNKSLLSLIIDAGHLPHNEVSTVVDTTLNDIAVIREGQISFTQTSGKVLFSVHTHSVEETQDFASMVVLKHLDHLQTGPIIFALGGEMGCGKTQFAKGIAAQLKIKKTIKSPTYTLLSPYLFTLNELEHLFVHVDTWRIENMSEFNALHLDTYLQEPNIIAIEWADKFFERIKEYAQNHHALLLVVHMVNKGSEHRFIEVELASVSR